MSGARLVPNNQRDVHVFATPDQVTAAAANFFVQAFRVAVAARGSFSLALSGGSTPHALFKALASEQYSSSVDWQNLHVFWVDERVVPRSDLESNAGNALRLWLSHVPVPPHQLHPIGVEHGGEQAARAYDQLLRKRSLGIDRLENSPPLFDLTLLGLGGDGHTASVFPGSPAYEAAVRGSEGPLAMAVTGPTPPTSRVTLTVPALNRSATALFLITGTDKAEALAETLSARTDPPTPAALVRPLEGGGTWFLDRGAASVWRLG